MKNTLFVLASILFCSAASAAPQAAIEFDGCYQLYMPGAMYPAFCLQGTSEEGIGGSGARLAIFGTNPARVIQCSKSSGSDGTLNSYSYLLNGNKELSLENVKLVNGKKEGDAVLGNNRLKFLEIDADNAARLMKIANSARNCQ